MQVGTFRKEKEGKYMKMFKRLVAVAAAMALMTSGYVERAAAAASDTGTVNTEATTDTADTAEGSNTSDAAAEVQKPVRQFGILTVDKKGVYTLKDFSGDTNGRVEITETANIMIPLKKVAALFPDLKYTYDTKTKKATLQNLSNKKKLVFTLGSSSYYYYKNSTAKGVKKAMPYAAYVSKESKAAMVHMAVLKWIFDQTEGVKYYGASVMQSKGYDTTVQSGIIVYNPYQKVSALKAAPEVSNIGRTVRVTIPEGYSVPQIFTLLVKKGVCASEDLLYQVMYEYDFTYYPLIADIESNPNRCYPLEGYLYPDTYEFYRLSKAQDAIGKFLSNGKVKITESDKQKAEALGYTMDQILTIASLIEKEGTTQEIKYNISSVIYNRLAAKMKLGLDASINYVERYVKPYIDGDINRYNSYYNTYKCPALPAGPICNPGRVAINAALNPPQTDYLYFYSDEEDNYIFSREPHNQ